jgi:hypothetical protein
MCLLDLYRSAKAFWLIIFGCAAANRFGNISVRLEIIPAFRRWL